MIFKDRLQAGRMLGERIAYDKPDSVGNPKVIVLGIPRGGVVVAAEVSKVLECPLDVVVVRKLGVPGHEEFGFGAVDLDGQAVFDESTIRRLGLTSAIVEKVRQKELAEAGRREAVFRAGKNPLDLKSQIAVLVDDGLATGVTTQAAVNYTRRHRPSEIVLAVPVAALDTVAKLKPLVDDLIVLATPENFMAVGQFYEDFSQVSDAEVIKFLC